MVPAGLYYRGDNAVSRRLIVSIEREKGKILIVDDEAGLRLTLSKILQKDDYETAITGSGHEALEWIAEQDFDLVFVDLMMPEMDGITLLSKITELNADLPVLILTGNATLETAVDAVKSGARDYMHKPMDPELLIARVREIIEEQRIPQREREIMLQIQALVSELQQIRGGDMPPTVLNARSVLDPDRFTQLGPFQLDLHARHVSLNAKYIPISASNFDYLLILIRHSPHPVSYEALSKEAQGYDLMRVEAQEMARWRIYELRKAIEKNPKKPQHIITARGFGYKFVI